MIPRPNIIKILEETANNIISGARNPKNRVNTPYFFEYSLKKFENFTLDAGISDDYADLGTKTSIKFTNNNAVTAFLGDKLGQGQLSQTSMRFVSTFESKHFTDIVQAQSEENIKFRDYVEAIVV